ncbi:pyridoxamine 5'-phosphate oxidase family protein [Pedobacter sp.]|uniref:pyridoxamine 5'-phosphate oxidase family protein n=1 Tax=Pedobacter sp. TaxID=1411316 RepID=UPI003D7F5DE9
MDTEKSIKLLKEKIEDVRICMFTTLSLNNEFSSRPMATANVGDDGSIWFFTNEYSLKSSEISKDYNVNLTYSDPSKHSYLYINGKAELIDDAEKKAAYFSLMVKAWFPDGLEDSGLILIKVKPEVAEYWDNSASKMVVAFNMLQAIVTGDKYEEGQHEKIVF